MVSAPVESTAPVDVAFEGQYRVQLESFEGPLDLLLHLIQQHEIDILDIPVSFITEKYLAYLKLMRTLAIDVASEYLVMAATLVHIKSKMLLPSVPAGQEDDSVLDEEEDPRAELVRRLLEYQKYKAAGAELAERGTLGRDVFARGIPEAEPESVAPFASLGVFSLLDAFEKVLKRANIKIDHEVVFDRISITDRILELTEKLSERRSMRFQDMLLTGRQGGIVSRFDIVITFLAVLEMARLKLICVYQSDPLAPIHVELSSGETGAWAANRAEPEVSPIDAPTEGMADTEDADSAKQDSGDILAEPSEALPISSGDEAFEVPMKDAVEAQEVREASREGGPRVKHDVLITAEPPSTPLEQPEESFENSSVADVQEGGAEGSERVSTPGSREGRDGD